MEDNLFEFEVTKLFGVHNYKFAIPQNRRITFLTGPNGWGKTTILNALWGISAKWSGYMPPVFEKLSYKDARIELEAHREDMRGDVVINGVDGDAWENEEAGDNGAAAFPMKLMTFPCENAEENAVEGFDEMLTSLAEDAENPYNTKRLEILRDIVEKYIEDKTFDPVKGKGAFASRTTGRVIDTWWLSTGERNLVTIFAETIMAPQRALVLIDNPETCMHIIWQSMLAEDLERCLQLIDGHVILATHSPEIINGRWSESIDLYELEHPNKKEEEEECLD